MTLFTLHTIFIFYLVTSYFVEYDYTYKTWFIYKICINKDEITQV